MINFGLSLLATLMFPIPALGGCDSVQDCQVYCSIPWHQTVCTEYKQEMPDLDQDDRVLGEQDVQYPIAQLGNCTSREDCKAYCGKIENRLACVNFAQGVGLVTRKSELANPTDTPSTPAVTSVPDPPDQAEPTELDDPVSGIQYPIEQLGNCTTRQECKAYCEDPVHRQACFDFAQQHSLTKDSAQVDKELSGIQFPIAELGNCGNMRECDIYCDQPDHQESCMQYAKQHGIDPDNSGRDSMPKPGGCSSPAECEAYCSEPDHHEECSAAFRDVCERDSDNPDCAQMEEKRGPGGCSSQDECREYCTSNPEDQDCQRGKDDYCAEHPEECSRTGPGGCESEQECQDFCQNNPDDGDCIRGREEYCQKNPEECQDHEPRTGPGGCNSEQECRAYCDNNPNDEECRRDHEDYCAQNPEDCQNQVPQTGPGGCNSEQECQDYCQNNPNDADCIRGNEQFCREHPDECNQQSQDQNQDQLKVGPGGCQSEQECQDYCNSHPNDQACGGHPDDSSCDEGSEGCDDKVDH